MEHFVTLFNNLFLPQGLALHRSMERHIENYVLWILCVDVETQNVLKRLALPNIRLLKLSQLETVELIKVKPGRTLGEYCWTLTPFAPRFVFEADKTVERVTYLDADLWFRKHPKPIFDELDASGKQVLITDHAYAPEYDLSWKSGQFCVQFLTFYRDTGETVRKWWEERCIEWCFNRIEDGKFGDQKYLDDWPSRFHNLVHVLNDKEKALAPWNAIRFPYGNSIFFHFHGLRILSPKKINIGAYKIPKLLIQNVYIPYLKDLKDAVQMLNSIDYKIKNQGTDFLFIKIFFQKVIDVYKILKLLIPIRILKW